MGTTILPPRVRCETLARNAQKRNLSKARRKRNLPASQSHEPTVIKPTAKNLVPGNVKILKRGESMNLQSKTDNVVSKENRKLRVKFEDEVVDLVLGSTDRLGPEPETLQKEFNRVMDRYANPTFVASPPPSSLPVPGFLGRNR